MASNAAVPFWRAAGMTYISYSNICASLVRNCLKEPHKSEAINREKVHFSVSKWSDGVAEKPSQVKDLEISLKASIAKCTAERKGRTRAQQYYGIDKDLYLERLVRIMTGMAYLKAVTMSGSLLMPIWDEGEEGSNEFYGNRLTATCAPNMG
ncbi:hypothetical protein IFM89_011940 [Coptis chinensis]|uniref:ATP synthase subunit epsilon, mitochondrial n=1 Tax=Coptis chinensis TaxID=261450 RepID=A0A835LGY6_9MAGN|nr:hypothetical protein IFM89_011940 [Coptis chinensis]